MAESNAASGVVRTTIAQTPQLTEVVLEVSEAVAAQYTRPGQVVALKPMNGGDKPIYIALASSPGEARAFRLLLGASAAAQMAMKEGATWTFDGPFGKGYPVEAARGKDVLLFAVGSALAPIRTVVEAIRADRAAYGAVTIYVGAHTEADFPYADDLKIWEQEGMTVRRSLSRPWVQDVFRADPPPVDNAFAFICGMNDMMTAVTLALSEAGLPADAIGKNW